MIRLGERIKKIRKSAMLSQLSFAKSLGINRAHISRIETGTAKPSEQLIKSICREYDINEKWLRSGKGPMVEKSISPKAIQELGLKLEEIKWNELINRVKLINKIVDQVVSIEVESDNFAEFDVYTDHPKIIESREILKQELKMSLIKLQKKLSSIIEEKGLNEK